MRLWIKAVFVLAITTNAIGLDLTRFLGIGNQLLKTPEKPEQVEVIIYRQSVCIANIEGVPPCHIDQYNVKNHVKELSETKEDVDESENHTKKNQIKELVEIKEDVNESENRTKKNHIKELAGTKVDVDESDNHSTESAKVKESSSLVEKKLLTSKVVESVSLEDLDPSNLEEQNFDEDTKTKSLDLRMKTPEINELNTDFVRQGRYLVIPGYSKNVAAKPPIYVTKVVDSPVTATLVAKNCVPKIGISPCDDYFYSSGSSSEDFLQIPVEGLEVEKPQEPEDEAVNLWEEPYNPNYEDDKPEESEKPAKPWFFEGFYNFFSKPTVVETNVKPEVKPVIVVHTTQKPGLFGGLFKPGFGIFQSVTEKPEIVIIQKREAPAYVTEKKFQIPVAVEVPEKLRTVLSDDSASQKLKMAEFVQKPRIFGDFLSNLISPDIISSMTSFFEFISSLFVRPFGRSFAIERVDEKPFALEKPIYHPNAYNKRTSKSQFVENEKNHEVIKDPVYVYQKPAERPDLLGGVLKKLDNEE